MKKLLFVLAALVVLTAFAGAEAKVLTLDYTINAPLVNGVPTLQLDDSGQATMTVTATATATKQVDFLTLRYQGSNHQVAVNSQPVPVNGSYKATHTWAITYNQAGNDALKVTAHDKSNDIDASGNPLNYMEQSFVVVVNAPLPPNTAPTINAIDDADALAGQQLRVAVNANDQDAGDSITLSVDAASAALGMQIVISGQQSYVQWTPTAQDAGDHDVTVTATDSHGATAATGFTITVRNAPVPPAGNSAPAINSVAATSAVLEQTYRYEVLASDADGNQLTYSLTQKPTGMTINGNIVSWVPKTSGTFPVTIAVTDGQATAVQNFNIVVAPSLVLKSLEISANEVKPVGTFDVSIEVKNMWGTDAENVKATVKIIGLNDNEDLEQDVDFGRIDKKDIESGKATFQVPIDAKEKTYQVSVELSWDDENGVEYVADGQRTDSIKVKRMQHEVVMTESALSSEAVRAGDSTQLGFTLANIGKRDETVQVKVQSDALGVQAFSPTFELEAGKESTQFLPFTIGKAANAGRQLVTITVLFNDGRDSNSQTTVLEVKAPTTQATQDVVSVLPTGAVTVSQAPMASAAKAPQPAVDINLVVAVGIIAAAIVVTMAILVTALVPPRAPRAPTTGSRVLRRGGQ